MSSTNQFTERMVMKTPVGDEVSFSLDIRRKVGVWCNVLI